MDKANKLIIGSISGWAVLILSGVWSFTQFVTPKLNEGARLDAENAYLKEQLIQMKEDKGSLQKTLDALTISSVASASQVARNQDKLDQCNAQLREAKDQLSVVSSLNSKLTVAAESTQRCAPYRKEIDNLQQEMAGRTFETLGRPPEAERKAELKALIAQHQQTLQTCLSAGR